MLKYLVVLLDDTAVSYCHYDNPKTECKRISLSDLEAAILWAMKENLMLQFVYPAYELPQEYTTAIETMFHCKIMPAVCSKEADIVVMDCWEDLMTCRLNKDRVYVLRTGKKDFFDCHDKIEGVLTQVARLNVILTDVETFTETDFDIYKSALETFIPSLSDLCQKGAMPQLNLLTDRMMLDAMNNCNAGWESVTLAPDGNFYTCPAFYLSGNGYPIGSLDKGLSIKILNCIVWNMHLFVGIAMLINANVAFG